MKKFIIVGMLIGSGIGSYIPLLWGGSVLSMSSVLFGAIGGLLGIWSAYRIFTKI